VWSPHAWIAGLAERCRSSILIGALSLDVVIVVVVVSLVEIAGLVYIAKQGRGIRDKMDTDDAAIYLQGRRIEDVLREMRSEQLGR